MRMQKLAFVCTFTFRMKSMESFINETPDVCKVWLPELDKVIEAWLQLCM